MATTQAGKAEKFRSLHERPDGFVIPNPWDVATARMLAGLGFEALATTSGGFALTLGRRDNEGAVTRDAALAHARALVEACDLPVSADLENGYADDPESVAETVRLAASVGLVGCSIEDATGDRSRPIYEKAHAVERVRAAVEAAAVSAIPFHVDGTRGELSTGPARSRRYHRPPARIRSSRRRCALRPQPA